MKQFLFILSLLLISSCSSDSVLLEEALRLAGDNKGELEKVLKYYSANVEDSLKYKAAVFLIENMPGHYSYKDTTYMTHFYNAIDSAARVYKTLENSQKDEMYWQVVEKYNKSLEVVEDIQYITAEYLIDNIEKSFEHWENGRWTTHLSFEDFCEFVLPYKAVETQMLDNWRDYLQEICHGDLEKQRHYSLYKNSSYYACETVNWHLRELLWPRLNSGGFPVRRMSTLLSIPSGHCDDFTSIALAMMRARGIPTAFDFTPLWGMRNLGHSWDVLLENTGKMVVFEGAGPVPGTPHKKDHKMTKVFRKTYSINDELLAMHLTETCIPKIFESYHIKDVTNEYMVTKDIQVELNPEIAKANYLYLALFDNEKWEPIHWAKVSGKKVVFKDMGRDVVYMPVAYIDKKVVPFSDPILLTARGQEIHLKADTINKQTLLLCRKFPPFQSMYDVSQQIINGKIEVSTEPSFGKSTTKTLYTIEKPGINTEEIDLSDMNESYRYWRYLSPDGSYCYIAELLFYEKDSIRPTYGKIIGTKDAYEDIALSKKAAFDGNALTYFDSSQKDGSWVGMDFGKNVNIDRVVYMPRSDGNLIEPGDEYELVYWADNEWKSLGKQMATRGFLEYDNCPTNALFLLHNHTKGKEERIFTYEEGEQKWW